MDEKLPEEYKPSRDQKFGFMKVAFDGMQYTESKQYGIVHFTSSPSGANIYVDGQILIKENEESVKTPATVKLLEGRRNFIMTLQGHVDVPGYVDVLPNVSVNIHKNLTPGKSEEGWGEPEPQIWLHENFNFAEVNKMSNTQKKFGFMC